MNRRELFRLVAGSAAWLATRHVAWAFPEPVHVIPHRYLYAEIRLSPEVLRAQAFLNAWETAYRAEMENLIRDIARGEEFLFTTRDR